MKSNLYIDHVLYAWDELEEKTGHQKESEYVNKVCDFYREWKSNDQTITAFTSGSTGKPKAILLSKADMTSSAQATGTFFGFTPKDRHFCPLSVQYIAGKMMCVRSLHWDTVLHLPIPSSNPLEQIHGQYDFAVMTPHQLSMGLNSDFRKNIHKVKTLLLGGSPVSQKLEEAIQSLKTAVYIGYGMTETMSHVALKRLNGAGKSSFFTAVDGVSFSQDDRGCLVIHTDHLSIPSLVTNDVVELKDKFRFQWKGRADFVINSGGIKIFPEQVERKLQRIIPQPFYITKQEHPDLGEQVILIVEGKIIEGLNDKLRLILSKYEMPKSIQYQSTFSYTPTGKIIRK